MRKEKPIANKTRHCVSVSERTAHERAYNLDVGYPAAFARELGREPSVASFVFVFFVSFSVFFAPKNTRGMVCGRMTLRSSKGLSLGVSSRRVASGASGSRRRTVMKADQVATQYATAFVQLAKDKNVLDDVRSDMDSVASLMKNDAKLSSFLTNPVADSDKKKELIGAIAKEGEFSALSSNFLCLLVDKQRIGGIADICDSFENIYCEVTDTEVATVTSAAALDNDQQFEIAKKLQKLTGAKNIKLKPKVDSSLISGLVIQYGKGGSKLLDMSAKGQLAAIEAQLLSQAPSA